MPGNSKNKRPRYRIKENKNKQAPNPQHAAVLQTQKLFQLKVVFKTILFENSFIKRQGHNTEKLAVVLATCVSAGLFFYNRLPENNFHNAVAIGYHNLH